jgi:hypothetical protein
MIQQGVLFKECEHRRTVILPEKRSSIHHAREVCADCRQFIGWVPKPETVRKRIENSETLAELCLRDDLDDWSRHFVRSVSGLKNLSPKQQKVLDNLRLKYLEEQK